MARDGSLHLITTAIGVEAFRERIEPYLLRAEAVHCLLLGGKSQSASTKSFAVERASEIVAMASVTPPRNLILSRVADPDAIPFLAGELQTRQITLPGVIGPVPEVDQIAMAWQEATGRQTRLAMRERVFQANAVELPAGVPGSWRSATPADRPLLLAWVGSFAIESLPPEERATFSAELMVDFRLAPPAGWVLWLDESGEPVSTAGYGSPTPNGIRLSPVYTPPAYRRRGYGSAVTAATTRMLLDRGYRFVFLFTDLANPTSNHIYAEVAYQPVADFAVYLFGSDTKAG